MYEKSCNIGTNLCHAYMVVVKLSRNFLGACTITFLFTQVLMAFAGYLLLPYLLKSLGELGVYICIDSVL